MADYDFGSLATAAKKDTPTKGYDFGGLASPVKSVGENFQPKKTGGLADQIPTGGYPKAPEPNQEKAGEYDRMIDAASAGMMAVPIVGGAAGLALKGMGKAPMIAEGIGKYTRPILESAIPLTGRALAGLGISGAAAGVGGELARSSAEKSGASKDVQNLAEMGGGMAPGAIGLGARELVRGGKNAMANSMKSIFDRPFAREGAELSKSTGIRLTPGQESGHQGISLGENSARQSFVTSDKVLKADQEQAQQAIAAVKKIADGISAQDLSKAGIGERLQTAMNNAVENIAKVRKSTGDKDYAEVRALANGKPVIPYNNVTKELQAIIEENTGVVSADARKIVSQAKSQLAEMMETQEPSKILNANGKIPPPPKPLPKVDDVETARRNRSSWSKAARGQGDIFTDVSPDANRVVASRLARAIGKDFEEASSAKTPFADALKKANKNYADYSDSITYVNNSSLGKLLGIETTDAGVTGAISNTISGEKVAQRFLAMQPSEAKTVANILKQHAPDVLQESKSYIVRDALKKGLDVPISKGANAIPLSYNKVIKGLPDNEYLEAVGFTHKEVLEINNVSKAMQRSGDRSGMNFSGTAPMNHFIEMLGTLTGGTKKILSTAAQVTVLNKIASAMTKKEGREALMTIAKFDPRKQASREITKAVTIINAENTDNK